MLRRDAFRPLRLEVLFQGIERAERALELADGADRRAAWVMRGCAFCALGKAYFEAGLVRGGHA